MTTDLRQLVRSVLLLQRLPQRHFADACRIRPANLSAWLRGGNTVSAEKIARLVRTLGIEDETIKPGVVHLFEIRDELGPFRRVLESTRATFEMTLCGPEGDDHGEDFKAQFIRRLTRMSFPAAAIHGCGYRLLVFHNNNERRQFYEACDPAALPCLSWRSGDGGPSAVELPKAVWDRIQRGRAPTAEEFDRYIGQQAPTWNDVRHAADAEGLTPSDLLALIAAHRPAAGS